MVMKTAITKKAFTFVEIILVVAILGILAALIFPVFQNNVTKAKEAAARESLRIVRNVIELYAAQHNGVPPGYPGNDMSQSPGDQALFVAQMVGAGKYLKSLPENPFNEKNSIKILSSVPDEPQDEVTGQFGWIYTPVIKDFTMDWQGEDSQGNDYFDY